MELSLSVSFAFGARTHFNGPTFTQNKWRDRTNLNRPLTRACSSCVVLVNCDVDHQGSQSDALLCLDRYDQACQCRHGRCRCRATRGLCLRAAWSSGAGPFAQQVVFDVFRTLTGNVDGSWCPYNARRAGLFLFSCLLFHLCDATRSLFITETQQHLSNNTLGDATCTMITNVLTVLRRSVSLVPDLPFPCP